MSWINLFSLSISAVYVTVVWRVAKCRGGNAGALCASVIGAGAMALLFCVFPALFFSAILVCAAVLACLVAKARPCFVLLWSVVATVIGHYGAYRSSDGWIQRRRDLRAEFPLESIADRLAYEHRDRGVAVQRLPQLSDHVSNGLVSQESDDQQTLRYSQLELLHDQKYDEFIRAGGFGFRRMGYVNRDFLVLSDLARIPFDRLPADKTDGFAGTSDIRHTVPPPPQREPETNGLLKLHRIGQFDFLHPERMGYLRDRDHVAGFFPHAFSRMPGHRDEKEQNPRSRKWRITRLELVSLLRHKTPVAYLSENLPRMDDLKSARTRPLTEFESRALRRLREEKDLVVERDVDRIVMLGSLRAGKSCLKCHSVQRGELLGAFSYELFPDPAGSK